MVFNATVNNISVISWWSVLLVKETGGNGENHRPVATHWQTLSLPLLINALVYPYRVDGIKQTYKHGYIYIYTHEHTNQSYIKTNIIIMQLYWVHSPQG